ncbi:MAG: deoxyguanosinetriphosphate triphosphohydrolase [Gammaproteobacteria bacterium]|uniref:deoxyguanosinetriphosphate triphosphohydrolase n=1 Tax=Rhodoferax sp. TaxID=50421 RepID=UPI00179205F3|nr:deoxyguanosinetriphosphate triphosphohydrolase [Rhodoferax sp.]MBU3900113.1 deoxyguanosinetriphosphate triphosphohydrolase [Gammaproteobacteria bacterium]MBA3059787.1 deoxyguanosinetriphosphate triphosphohydrolase [Rhodoferax sp.]MBU3998740.1 deoxyguanosinetriphosphate triphosphohydrolase [Gammaproteobacteria bacterium]MBU4018297.1 deoxyguanosinetriphosphate triphosphohydrolase [Gammaproteobacteria bacterium]MBU4082151.1 deoxyguanosinetriphosphate triphosphohydrolase [Gammaproteobacteria ba
MTLACYACDPAQSRGRHYPQAPAPTRSEYQRDRDRIVHSTAFRRLVYKTQVFVNHEGDLFRTRLTHSLEVAQLGRSVARSLQLNEDLVEAIALAHDLGHTPFGHAGQDALNDCMRTFGGFEHNLQSLRVVDHLEERYPQFDGLNLSFETREGILKHCSRSHAQALALKEPGGVSQRFLDGTQPSLEAQLCNLADEIAYNAHDIDDGVRSGLITLEQLEDVPLFDDFRREALAEYPLLQDAAQGRRLLYEATRRMLTAQVYDVINATTAALRAAAPTSVDAVRQLPPLLQFGPAMRLQSQALKTFLLHQLYRHPQVMQTMDQAQRIVHELFSAYLEQPQEMGEGFMARAQAARDAVDARSSGARVVADYIAGMTDRFAAREHERLTGVKLL